MEHSTMAKYNNHDEKKVGVNSCIFCTINFLFFIFGIALSVLGVWIYLDDRSFYDFFSNDLDVDLAEINEFFKMYIYESSLLITVIGFIILFVSCLGCCSIFTSSSFLITVYSTLLVVIFMVEITMTSMAFSYREQLDTGLKIVLNEPILQNYSKDTPRNLAFVKAFNDIMIDYDCCGLGNHTDFIGHPKRLALAPQHCKSAFEGHRTVIGCYEVFQDWLSSRLEIFLSIGVATIMIQIFCIIVSCCIAYKSSSSI